LVSAFGLLQYIMYRSSDRINNQTNCFWFINNSSIYIKWKKGWTDYCTCRKVIYIKWFIAIPFQLQTNSSFLQQYNKRSFNIFSCGKWEILPVPYLVLECKDYSVIWIIHSVSIVKFSEHRSTLYNHFQYYQHKPHELLKIYWSKCSFVAYTIN
jgi:hypothetical protein